jgi:hypothetical protein
MIPAYSLLEFQHRRHILSAVGYLKGRPGTRWIEKPTEKVSSASPCSSFSFGMSLSRTSLSTCVFF